MTNPAPSPFPALRGLTLPAKNADPLLIAATVLLVVMLVGIVIAAAASMIGLVVNLASGGIPYRMPLWHADWLPISSALFALGALWLMADIAVTLLGMIAAVGNGETFASANVTRMERLAWRVIELQILAAIARGAGSAISGDINGLEIGLDLSPAGIAFALILFILARVFRQGAQLRDDLEGTV